MIPGSVKELLPKAVAVTAGGYSVGYAFEAGYLNYFGISSTFMQVDLSTLIFSIAFTGIVGGIVFNNLQKIEAARIAIGSNDSLKPTTRYYYQLGTIVFVAFLFWAIYSIDRGSKTVGQPALAGAIFCSAYLLFQLIRPVFSMVRWRESFSSACKRLATVHAKNSKDSNVNEIEFLIGTAALLLGAAYISGSSYATNRQWLPAVKSGGETLVIVQTYGNDVYLKPFNVQSQEFGGTFRIENLDQLSSIFSQQVKKHGR